MSHAAPVIIAIRVIVESSVDPCMHAPYLVLTGDEDQLPEPPSEAPAPEIGPAPTGLRV